MGLGSNQSQKTIAKSIDSFKCCTNLSASMAAARGSEKPLIIAFLAACHQVLISAPRLGLRQPGLGGAERSSAGSGHGANARFVRGGQTAAAQALPGLAKPRVG
jgi:hypothetical protein